MSSESRDINVLACEDSSSILPDFQWHSVRLPHSGEWPPELIAAAERMEFSPLPMLLLIGHSGMIAPNAPMKSLFFKSWGRDFTGRSILEIFPECAETLQHLTSGRTARWEPPLLLSLKDQDAIRSFHIDFVPVANRRGTIVGLQGVATDVTRYLERIRVLSETEERFRLALQSSGMVGIWDLDVKTNVSTSDANVARTFGISPEDCQRGIDDSVFIHAIHADDQERVAQTLQTAIATKTTYRCKYRVMAHDGHMRWVITSGKPCFNEAGELIRLLGVVVDVTDQMETARALQESRFHFETLIETIPQIVWSCDAQGNYDYFSRRWSEFTGIPIDQATEETWKQLVAPEHWDKVSSVWEDARRHGKNYDIDYQFRHHSGAYRWLKVMAMPVRDERGQITRWFGTSTDVHEAYLAAAERERLTQELERLATEDQLTNALTRRAFLDRARTVIQESAESGASVGLIMLDIDHFKSINDTFGHPGGDKVLSIASRRIKASVSQHDLFGRLGGEEFGILLKDCTSHQTQKIAERIRQVIHQDPITLDDGTQIDLTISVGSTSQIPSVVDLDYLMLMADKALYAAKASGRNRSIYLASRMGMANAQ